MDSPSPSVRLPSRARRPRGPPPPTHCSADNPRIQALLAADSAANAALFPPPPQGPPTATQPASRPLLRKSRSALNSSSSSSPSLTPSPAVHATRLERTKTLLETILHIRDSLPLSIPPLVPVHQLHGALGHATCDDEIAKLEAVRAVRRFKVGNLGEICVMLVCDYEDSIRAVAGAFASGRCSTDGDGGGGGGCSAAVVVRGPDGESPKKKVAVQKVSGRNIGDDVFDRFLTYATNPTTGLFVTKSQLTTSMRATDDEIGELFSYGFLTLKDVDTYWVSVRNAGVFWSGFARGRTEVLQTLKKRKHGEMLKAHLEEKPLRGCAVPVDLVLLDLLGKGSIESLDAPLGTMIRLRKRGTGNLNWT
ncbi:Serine/threonine-protein kinase 19 [Geranomyces variabilis]|uniref:Serine/threonine-protein kinase 19 n=1 Tax=Geranomyces variabilis TaxID=109894 RepID=A0AAD5XMC5_9FUNG|nr:Serine/threonine-protein kinase 19 [Geranomyces variabilis]